MSDHIREYRVAPMEGRPALGRFVFRRKASPPWPASGPGWIAGYEPPTTWAEAEAIRVRLPEADEFEIVDREAGG